MATEGSSFSTPLHSLDRAPYHTLYIPTSTSPHTHTHPPSRPGVCQKISFRTQVGFSSNTRSQLVPPPAHTHLHRAPATTTPTHPSTPKGQCQTHILAHTRSYHKSFETPTTIHETLPDACPYNCTSPPTIYLPSPSRPFFLPFLYAVVKIHAQRYMHNYKMLIPFQKRDIHRCARVALPQVIRDA